MQPAKKYLKHRGKVTLEKLAQMVGRGFAAVDKRFVGIEGRLDGMDARLAVLEVDMMEVKERLTKLEQTVSRLVETLDAFAKRLDDDEQEFIIVRDEVRVMKRVLKERFRIDIDALRHR